MVLAAGEKLIMTRSRSKILSHAPSATSAARVRRTYALADIDVAPENLRYGEPADPDISVLAETLIAAGQLQPLTVRPGRSKTERLAMALDGRRRILALRLLQAEGRISDDFAVDVFVETDLARQAAAAVLTNTAAPVHIADVIRAIGRMLKAKLTVGQISRALGYAEVDIKRYAALSALPEVAFDALRQGRMNLRQARLLARLSDPAEQSDLAQEALEGRGFQDWRITERLEEGRITTRDARFSLVGLDGYCDIGGRIETDLFGELAPVLLDPDRLTQAWMSRARGLALAFEAEGLAVHVTAGPQPDLPADLDIIGYVYGGALTQEELDAYRDLRDRYEEAASLVASRLENPLDGDGIDVALITMIRARLAMDQTGCGGALATTLVFRPDASRGVEVRCYAPTPPETCGEPDGETKTSPITAPPRYQAPVGPVTPPETDGVNHALHAIRTDVATRGLIRALADDPATAMTALIAQLFAQIVVHAGGLRPDAALSVHAAAFNPSGGRVIETLDGHVRQRLDDRRAVWEASGQTVIAWVHTLEPAAREGLMAELVALSLNLHEERTSAIRALARSEAGELARLCDAEINRHWTPDAAFLRAHSKAQLLAMLETMNQSVAQAGSLKKPALVDLAAETAAAASWAPSVLTWGRVDLLPEGEDDTGIRRDDPGATDRVIASESDDGAGAVDVPLDAAAPGADLRGQGLADTPSDKAALTTLMI